LEQVTIVVVWHPPFPIVVFDVLWIGSPRASELVHGRVASLRCRQRFTPSFMPSSKLSRLNFSFGECGLSSGNAKPRSKESAPMIFLMSLTTGMEPPSRGRTGSLPNETRKASSAALASGLVGETRYGSPP